MKIYFAGSIRGGRDDVDFYSNIVKKLAMYGEVLSEHVGDTKLTSIGQTNITDTEIYNKDTKWISEADIIIAEVTSPSLGVGYEIGFAESLGKKIICIYREIEGRRISAMILGNTKLIVRSYSAIEDLDSILKEYLESNTL